MSVRVCRICCIFVIVVVFTSPLSSDGRQRRVWVDFDNSAGLRTGDAVHDVDDAMALMHLLASLDVSVVGISPVHANAPMAWCMNATKELLRRFFPDSKYDILEGATGVGTVLTPTVESLAHALSEEPLTLLALGSLSNVGTLLVHFPHLHHRIEQIIFVGGRRNLQPFRIGSFNTDSLPDLNFDRDQNAADILLRSAVPLTLVPFELSQKVGLGKVELDEIRSAGGSSDILLWLADVAQAWLDWLQKIFKVEYFHPFDSLAAIALTHPEELKCDRLMATIRRAKRIQLAATASQQKLHRLIEDDIETQLFLDVSVLAKCHEVNNTPCREVTYCHTPSARVKSLIMQRLLSYSKPSSRHEL